MSTVPQDDNLLSILPKCILCLVVSLASNGYQWPILSRFWSKNFWPQYGASLLLNKHIEDLSPSCLKYLSYLEVSCAHLPQLQLLTSFSHLRTLVVFLSLSHADFSNCVQLEALTLLPRSLIQSIIFPVNLRSLKDQSSAEYACDLRLCSRLTFLSTTTLWFSFLPISLKLLRFETFFKPPKNIFELTELSELHCDYYQKEKYFASFLSQLPHLEVLHLDATPYDFLPHIKQCSSLSQVHTLKVKFFTKPDPYILYNMSHLQTLEFIESDVQVNHLLRLSMLTNVVFENCFVYPSCLALLEINTLIAVEIKCIHGRRRFYSLLEHMNQSLNALEQKIKEPNSGWIITKNIKEPNSGCIISYEWIDNWPTKVTSFRFEEFIFRIERVLPKKK